MAIKHIAGAVEMTERVLRYEGNWSRRDFMGALGKAAVLLPSIGILEACLGPAATTAAAKKGGHLIWGGQDIGGLNPLLTSDLLSGSVAGLFYDPLIEIDNNANPVPLLAADQPTISADNLSFTFKLRPGLKWSDGQPITTDDVIWTFRLLYAPEYAAVAFGDQSTARSTFDTVTAPDSSTVVFKTKVIFAPFLTYFATVPILPKHVFGSLDPTASAAQIAAYGAAFNTHQANNNPAVTSGPWKLVNWQHGSQLTLARNDAYYLGAPLLDGVIFRVIGSDASSVLLTDEVDMSEAIVPADIAQLKGSGSVDVFSAEGAVVYAAPNLRPGTRGFQLFGDQSVRQALMYGLDRQSMVNGIFFGQARVPNSWVGDFPSDWAYDPSVGTKYAYDKVKAEAMLDAAGWTKNSSGVREKNGLQMMFDFPVPTSHQTWVQVAEAMQEQWSQIGVIMNPLQVTSANWLDRNLHKRDFDMITNNATWGGFDQDPTRIISSAAAQPGGQNASGYTSSDIDALCAQGSGSTDRTQRKIAYSKLQPTFMTVLPQLPIIAAPNLFGASKRLQNVNIGSWTQLTNWYWMNKVSVTSGQ